MSLPRRLASHGFEWLWDTYAFHRDINSANDEGAGDSVVKGLRIIIYSNLKMPAQKYVALVLGGAEV